MENILIVSDDPMSQEDHVVSMVKDIDELCIIITPTFSQRSRVEEKLNNDNCRVLCFVETESLICGQRSKHIYILDSDRIEKSYIDDICSGYAVVVSHPSNKNVKQSGKFVICCSHKSNYIDQFNDLKNKEDNYFVLEI